MKPKKLTTTSRVPPLEELLTELGNDLVTAGFGDVSFSLMPTRGGNWVAMMGVSEPYGRISGRSVLCGSIREAMFAAREAFDMKLALRKQQRAIPPPPGAFESTPHEGANPFANIPPGTIQSLDVTMPSSKEVTIRGRIGLQILHPTVLDGGTTLVVDKRAYTLGARGLHLTVSNYPKAVLLQESLVVVPTDGGGAFAARAERMPDCDAWLVYFDGGKRSLPLKPRSAGLSHQAASGLAQRSPRGSET